MNDQQTSAGPGAPSENPKPGRVGRGISYVERKFQERRAKKQKESSADRAARRTATATYWIAVFTFVTVCVGATHYLVFHKQLEVYEGQFRIMAQQLVEIQTASGQTDRMIAAQERQVAALGDLAKFTKDQSETTGSVADRQLRARISIISAEVTEFETGIPINALIRVKNTGQGTANGTMRAIVRVVPITDSKFTIDRKTLAARLTVNPNVDALRPVRSLQSLTEQQKAAVANGTYAIMAFGDFQFRDEFGTNTKCYYRLFSRSGMARTSPVLHPTAAHNYCDEEKAPPRR